MLPLAEAENEFLERLLDHGEIVPALALYSSRFSMVALRQCGTITEDIARGGMHHFESVKVSGSGGGSSESVSQDEIQVSIAVCETNAPVSASAIAAWIASRSRFLLSSTSIRKLSVVLPLFHPLISKLCCQ